MGLTVRARCTCGYQTGDMPIGGGKASFREHCAFPVVCEDCGRLGLANLLAAPSRCPTCDSERIVSYDDPRLCGRKGQNVVARWNVGEGLGRELVLTDGEYYCPACHAFSLTFEPGSILWD